MRSRRHQQRSPLAIGVIALVVILIITFLGFTKDIPFTKPYELKATFASANSIRPGAPVRIAGVNVGKVAKVEPSSNGEASVVTLQISKQGLPIHKDATAKIRPRIFLEGNFFVDLRPGIRALRTAAPVLSSALETGIRVLPRTPPLDRRLAALLDELRRFSNDPLVPQGIKGTTQAVNDLNPTLQFLAPTQLKCNYITLWFRNISSLLSEGDRNGTWQRFIIVTTPQGPNNEGGPSSAPANGPTVDNHLHSNPYPNTAAPGQPKECEAGNENYLVGRQVIGNVPGNSGTKTAGQPEPQNAEGGG